MLLPLRHNLQPGLRIRIDLMQFRIRIRIQHFFYLRIRIWILGPDPGFDDLKLKKFKAGNFNFYFLIKIAIYLSLGLYKGRPSYRRSLQRTSSTSKHKNYFFFVIFALLDPQPWFPHSLGFPFIVSWSCFFRFFLSIQRAVTYGIGSEFNRVKGSNFGISTPNSTDKTM